MMHLKGGFVLTQSNAKGMSVELGERLSAVPSVIVEPGALPGDASEALRTAYDLTRQIVAGVRQNAPLGYDLNMLVSGSGDRIATHKEQATQEGNAIGPTGVTTAIRVLAGAAHCAAVQRRIETGRKQDRRPLVHYTSVFNRWIRQYGLYDADARRSHLERAIGGVVDLVEPESSPISAGRLSRNVGGAQYELGGTCVLVYGQEEEGLVIGEASTEADHLQGVDLFAWRRDSPGLRVGIDLKASDQLVAEACNLPKAAQYGIRNGVLVLCPGLKSSDLRDRFVVAPDVAREVYLRHRIGEIISEAFDNPDIRKDWSGIR